MNIKAMQGKNDGFNRQSIENVVITGASAGVGPATAHAFAKRGANVGLIARGTEGLNAACKEVEALRGRALAVRADVADSEVQAWGTMHRGWLGMATELLASAVVAMILTRKM